MVKLIKYKNSQNEEEKNRCVFGVCYGQRALSAGISNSELEMGISCFVFFTQSRPTVGAQ